VGEGGIADHSEQYAASLKVHAVGVQITTVSYVVTITHFREKLRLQALFSNVT
jgi:hypothetical protein